MTAIAGDPRASITAFAELRARLSDPFADRAALLAAHGLDERSLAAIEADWCGQLAGGDAAAALSRQYGDAYSNMLARLAAPEGEPRPGLDEASAAASRPEPPAPVAAPPAAPHAESAAPRPIAVPSFLKDRPEAASAPPPAAPAAPPAMAAPPAALSTGTAAVDLASILQKPVPFDPFAKPPPRPAEPPERAPAPRTPLTGETTDVDVAAIARRVLAFGPPGARSPAPAAPRPPEPQRPAAPPAVVVRPPEPQRPEPGFTLDRYALLSAEIAMVGPDPAGRHAVFKRFGVTDPDTLTAEWRARFAADPALAGRWSAAYAHHYARLRTERGGGR